MHNERDKSHKSLMRLNRGQFWSNRRWRKNESNKSISGLWGSIGGQFWSNRRWRKKMKETEAIRVSWGCTRDNFEVIEDEEKMKETKAIIALWGCTRDNFEVKEDKGKKKKNERDKSHKTEWIDWSHVTILFFHLNNCAT